MSEPSTIRILIADDHLVVRMGLRSMIDTQADMTVIGEAADGREAVDAFLKHRPDIVLMDLRMPGMNGLEAIAAIRARDPSASVIVLTTYDADENIFRALQSGARAYLLKDIPAEQFLEAIRSVRSGKCWVPPSVAARLAQRMPCDELSSREEEVLRLIVDGMSNKEIASALDVTESTVKNHVNSILAKLKVRDRTQAATAALRRGLVAFE